MGAAAAGGCSCADRADSYPWGDPRAASLGRERAPLWDGAELPLREAELLIRSGLGERELVSGIDKKLITLIRMQVFLYAVEDLKMSSSDVDRLIGLAEEYVAEDKAAEQHT